MDKATKHKFIEQFLKTKINEYMIEDTLNNTLRKIDPNNTIFSLIPTETEVLITDMLETIVGPELMDWVYWWWLECDHGTKKMGFEIDGKEYVTGVKMTLEEFLNIVDGE